MLGVRHGGWSRVQRSLAARGPVRGGQVRPAGSGGGVGGRRGEADWEELC